jgi:histidinol dehydrogenase
VNIYVPGGKASYPSSVLMSAIPAHVAGFNKIIIVVSAPDVELTPVVLAAIAGVNKVTTVFGGQAIAALA